MDRLKSPTLSELRAKKAQAWIDKEILKLLLILHEIGVGKVENFQSKGDIESAKIAQYSSREVQTNFGTLFQVYQHVSVSFKTINLKAA